MFVAVNLSRFSAIVKVFEAHLGGIVGKYKALRIISLFYRLLAVMVIIGGAAALILSLATKGSSLIVGILALMGAFIIAVVLYGLGELVQVFIDIEQAARENAAINRQLLKALGSRRD